MDSKESSKNLDALEGIFSFYVAQPWDLMASQLVDVLVLEYAFAHGCAREDTPYDSSAFYRYRAEGAARLWNTLPESGYNGTHLSRTRAKLWRHLIDGMLKAKTKEECRTIGATFFKAVRLTGEEETTLRQAAKKALEPFCYPHNIPAVCDALRHRPENCNPTALVVMLAWLSDNHASGMQELDTLLVRT